MPDPEWMEVQLRYPVIVTRWADGQIPSPPASPVPPTPTPQPDGLEKLRRLSEAATQEARYWNPHPHGHGDPDYDHEPYLPSVGWVFGCMIDCETRGGPAGCEVEHFTYDDAVFVQAAVAFARESLAAPRSTPAEQPQPDDSGPLQDALRAASEFLRSVHHIIYADAAAEAADRLAAGDLRATANQKGKS